MLPEGGEVNVLSGELSDVFQGLLNEINVKRDIGTRMR